MALGYEGFAFVGDTLCLCTGTSIPFSRNLMESNCGFGGDRYGWPHTYDYDNFDGSINFEIHPAILTEILSWWSNRETKRTIQVFPNSGSSVTISEAYFQSLSISSSEGSSVTGSISWVGISGTKTHNDDYIDNREGNQATAAMGIISPLNAGQTNLNPIPYWNTTVNNLEVLNWTLDISQEVQKIFTAQATSDPQAPSIIGIGTLTGGLTYDVYLNGASFIPPTSYTIVIGNETITITGDLETEAEDIAGQSDVVTVNVGFHVYGDG